MARRKAVGCLPDGKCPHCGQGKTVEGKSNRFLLRCNNFSECGRYVTRR